MAWRTAGKVVAISMPTVFVGSAAAWRWKNRVDLPAHELLDLRGRNVVLTGGTRGIGRALAADLVARGAHVIVGCRDLSQGQELCVRFTTEDGHLKSGRATAVHLDLADPGSILEFAAHVKKSVEASGGVHVLVNAAAEIKNELTRGADGIELTFAINHLGAQHLISSLVPELRRAASADRHSRVVLVGSRLERKGIVDLDCLQKDGLPDPRMLGKFDPMTNYGSSKLANMLLCKELQSRFDKEHVDVLIVSPGMVHTDLWRNFPTWYRMLTYPVRATFLRSPEESARGILHAVAARETEGLSGKYMCDGKMLESSVPAQDVEKASALFRYCSLMIDRGKAAHFVKRLGTQADAGAGALSSAV